MKKGTKFFGILGLSAACALTMATAFACAGNENTNAKLPEPEVGEVHVLFEGKPDSKLGEEGDLCFTAVNGKIYRKTQSEWVETEFREYSFENGTLSVTYPDGEVGLFSVQEVPQGTEEHEHTFGSEPAVIYPAHCVIPGIGVKVCTTCNESFVEILPADPDAHAFNTENYGQCDYCGKLESGGSMVVVESAENFTGALEAVEDGDVLVVGDAVEMSGETLEVVGKDITIDIAGHDLTLKNTGSDGKDGLSLENGANVTLTDSKGEGTLTLSNAGNSDNDIFLYNTDENTTTTLTLRDIDIECTYPSGMWNDRAPILAYAAAGHAVVNVEEGTHIHANSPTGRGLSCIAAEGAEVNLDGGIFDIEASRDGYIGGYTCAVNVGDGSDVNFRGGEINLIGKGGNVCGIFTDSRDASMNITMTGGTINLSSEDVAKPELPTEIVGIYADIYDYDNLHIVMESGTINVATGYAKGSEGIGLAFNTFRSENENVSWFVGEEFVITVDKDKGTGNFVYHYMNRGSYNSEPNLTIPERYNTPDLVG